MSLIKSSSNNLFSQQSMNKAFEGYRSCRLNYGSPSIELDRFYMKPSAEEESAFNLTNLRKLFGQESQDEKEESIRTIAHRQRTKSIWSTDDEDNASNGSASPSPPPQEEIMKNEHAPCPLLGDEKMPVLFVMTNSDLDRFFTAPSPVETKRFGLDGARDLFPHSDAPCFAFEDLGSRSGMSFLSARARTYNHVRSISPHRQF